MAAKKKSGDIGHAGQNVIRIIIASYFIGVSCGLISGTDATPLAATVLEPAAAEFVGGAVIFILGYLVMTGFALRFAAMLLGIVLFWSSYMTHFSATTPVAIDGFWKDMVLIAALMLTYMSGGARDISKFAMIRRKPKVRRLNGKSAITPRRVNATAKTNVTRLPRPQVVAAQESPVANIFLEDGKNAAAS